MPRFVDVKPRAQAREHVFAGLSVRLHEKEKSQPVEYSTKDAARAFLTDHVVFASVRDKDEPAQQTNVDTTVAEKEGFEWACHVLGETGRVPLDSEGEARQCYRAWLKKEGCDGSQWEWTVFLWSFREAIRQHANPDCTPIRRPTRETSIER